MISCLFIFIYILFLMLNALKVFFFSNHFPNDFCDDDY